MGNLLSALHLGSLMPAEILHKKHYLETTTQIQEINYFFRN